MIKGIKLRIYPNKTQIKVINETLGACRWIYNRYLEYNNHYYEETSKFLSGYDFSKIITELKKRDEKFMWLNMYSSKAIKDSIMRGEKAYKSFFNNQNGRPKFKSKKDLVQSYYFVKDQLKLNHNKIKIPILGWVRLTENIYEGKLKSVSGGRVIKENDKYYVTLTYQYEKDYITWSSNIQGLGIDVGIKSYATIYNGNYSQKIDNINLTPKVQMIEGKIKVLQRVISNKVEINKFKNMKGGNCYNTYQIKKVWKKIRNLKEKLNNIRRDFINKLCYSLVIAKPKYITIEDLDISQMLQNASSKLADHLAKCKLYYFKTHLTHKCHQFYVELRQADKWFASSKKCSYCGHKKKQLSLNDRIYVCEECRLEIDRDDNAAINLQRLEKYTVL